MTDSKPKPLRCDHALYGLLTDERWLEVKCKRRACGYQKGLVVLHTIDITSGKVVSTKRFTDPRITKENTDAVKHPSPAVRA
jgi:hypothetical protein